MASSRNDVIPTGLADEEHPKSEVAEVVKRLVDTPIANVVPEKGGK